MSAQTGYFNKLQSVAEKIFSFLSTITLTGTDGKTLTVTQDTTLDEAVSMSAKATQGVWTDYFASSTIVGWAASPTGAIWCKQVGSMMFVKFYITGTSNAQGTTFTLPVANNNDFDVYLPAGYTVNNGVASVNPGCIRPNKNYATVNLFRDITTGLAWTTSGIKTVHGEFFYEVKP